MNCPICCGRGFIVVPIYPEGEETAVPIEHLQHGTRRYSCPECGEFVHVETLANCNHVEMVHIGTHADHRGMIHEATSHAAHAIAEQLIRRNAFDVRLDQMTENLATRIQVRLRYAPMQGDPRRQMNPGREEHARRIREARRAIELERAMISPHLVMDPGSLGPRVDVASYQDNLEAAKFITPKRKPRK